MKHLCCKCYSLLNSWSYTSVLAWCHQCMGRTLITFQTPFYGPEFTQFLFPIRLCMKHFGFHSFSQKLQGTSRVMIVKVSRSL